MELILAEKFDNAHKVFKVLKIGFFSVINPTNLKNSKAF